MKPLVAISVIPVPNAKIREKLFPTEKSEIQIRENFFPRKAQNRRSETLNCRENFVPYTPLNVHLWFQSMVQKTSDATL